MRGSPMNILTDNAQLTRMSASNEAQLAIMRELMAVMKDMVLAVTDMQMQQAQLIQLIAAQGTLMPSQGGVGAPPHGH